MDRRAVGSHTHERRNTAAGERGFADDMHATAIAPGNVRELKNVIERAVILSPEGALRLPPSRASIRRPRVADLHTGSRRLVDVERDAIVDALKATKGVISGEDGAAAYAAVPVGVRGKG